MRRPDCRENPLRRSIRWSLIGNITNALLQWASLVVLGRIGSPEELGTLTLAIGVVTPIFMVLNLRLQTLQATDAEHHFDFSLLWGVRLTTSALALLVVGVAAAAYPDPRLGLVVLGLTAGAAAESYSNLLHGVLQRQERHDAVGRSLCIRGGAYLLGLIVPYYFTHDLRWAAFGSGLLRFLAVGYDIGAIALAPDTLSQESRVVVHGLWKPRLGKKETLTLVRVAGPAGLALCIAGVINFLPRYFLEGFASRASVGIFSAGWQLVMAGSIVVGSVSQTVMPRFARRLAYGDTEGARRLIWRLYALVFSLATAGTLLALGIGDWILRFLFGPGFEAAYASLVILALGSGFKFASAVAHTALVAMRQTRVELWATAIAFVICLGACWALIPLFGVEGASIAIGIASGTNFLVVTTILARNLHARSVRDALQANG